MLQELRYGWRMLCRSPAFTAVAVLSLALGIGGNTAIFSLIDAVMLRMLPVQNPEQLVQLTVVIPEGTFALFSSGQYERFRDRSQAFSSLLATASDHLNASIDGQTETASYRRLSSRQKSLADRSDAGPAFRIRSGRGSRGCAAGGAL